MAPTHLEDILAACQNNSKAIEQNLQLIEALKSSKDLLERTKISNDFTVS
jgi:hypothetical protein